MTVETLIRLALADIGSTDPDPEQLQNAFDRLNLIISNFTFWNPEDQPIYAFTGLSQTINLPPYYCDTFEMLLAAREAITYGLSQSRIQILELKAKQLTDKLTYRRTENGGYFNASGMVR